MNNQISLIYVFMSLLLISLLTYLYVNKGKETFCSCRNMINKICPDPAVLTGLYDSGKLTENTNFAKIQQNHNSNWKTVMPEDEFVQHNYN